MTSKIVLTALLVTSMSCTSNAQKIKADKVPTPVKEALTKAYPNAKEIEWDKEGKGFEASFEDGKDEISVVFDANGAVLETETEIEVSALPAKVLEGLKGKKVKEAAIIMKDGKTMYEAEVGKKDLFFDQDGNQIK